MGVALTFPGDSPDSSRKWSRNSAVRYLVGENQLDTERRELRRRGLLIAVEPQVFDLLVRLIRNRDRVVSKDLLLATIWSGRIVAETTIDSRVQAVRRVIGDSGSQQKMIRTFPRKGVRFIAAVEQSSSEQEPCTTPQGQVHSAMISDKPTIAILPFINLNSNPRHWFLAHGIAEDVIYSLARHPNLLVAARDSCFACEGTAFDARQIRSSLDVRYVVKGSVRAAGKRIRAFHVIGERPRQSGPAIERQDPDG